MNSPKPSLGTLEVHLTEDILTKFQAISGACDKSLNWVIVRALKTYLLNERKDILNSIEGQKQIARGEFEDIDHVIADMERILEGEENDVIANSPD